MRILIFLAASFLSTVGDTLLVFAVPAGMGLETGDIRSSVCMWLVPAVAMFLASFLNRKIQSREASARRDYGRLLIAIAALEIVIAALAMKFTSKPATLLLITAFVFFYALAKEGIPRLLYLVSVYRYFIDPQGYARISSLSMGLNILASFAGTALAALLIFHGGWLLSLILDALTFVGFGGAILLFGKDVRPEPEAPAAAASTAPDAQAATPFRAILAAVPLLFGVNALVWNYLPLLSKQFSLMSAGNNILAISVLRIPGMLCAFAMPWIARRIPHSRLVKLVPALFIGASLAFALAPSSAILCLLILAHGLLSGVYWPSDFAIRNRLPHAALIQFNVRVLRRLALFQFASCLLALLIYAPEQLSFGWVAPLIACSVALSLALTYRASLRSIPAWATVPLLAIALATTGGCRPAPSAKPVFVYLPSVTRNLELRSDLTYAAMTILNDTSAHFLKVSDDLTLQPELLKSYDKLEQGRKYQLELDPDYRSALGEALTSEDVAFTIRYYLSAKPELKGALVTIAGAASCHSLDCPLPGLRIEGPHRMALTLEHADLHFIDRLASPWLILLRKDRPVVQELGACRIPYPTGQAALVGCDARGIELKLKGRTLLISDRDTSPQGYVHKSLLTTNPGKEVSPTLTVMSAFANPVSKSLTEAQRVAIMTAIRAGSEKLAQSIHLQKSDLLTPQWLALTPPADITQVQAPKSIRCPAQPLKILLDTSLPDLTTLSGFLRSTVPCPIEFTTTQADRYFQDFQKADIGICWFTPDTLDLYNSFTSLDCSPTSNCYFNWHDSTLQGLIDRVRGSSEVGSADKVSALEIERLLLKRGYVAPLAELNWWISGPEGNKRIHPAGLFQVSAEDYL